MGKVKKLIRLYRAHDLDLITFIESHEFDFLKAVYCALNAFANDELFVIYIPPRRETDIKLNTRHYRKTLTLDEERDKKAIEILNKISDGHINNFLKNLVRQYLCVPMSEDFLINEEDANFFYEKFEMFRAGKKVVKAGKLVKKNKKSSNKVNNNVEANESGSLNNGNSIDNTIPKPNGNEVKEKIIERNIRERQQKRDSELEGKVQQFVDNALIKKNDDVKVNESDDFVKEQIGMSLSNNEIQANTEQNYNDTQESVVENVSDDDNDNGSLNDEITEMFSMLI